MRKVIYYRYFITSLMIFACFSCEKEKKYSQLNENQILAKGEWFNTLDSLNVMSIRNHKIVFIKNARRIDFTPDDVRIYSIVDSLKKNGNTKIHIGQYLIMKGNKDTIAYKILERKDSVITLKKDNKNQTFIWKFIAHMAKK
jgi:hypothetical protein